MIKPATLAAALLLPVLSHPALADTAPNPAIALTASGTSSVKAPLSGVLARQSINTNNWDGVLTGGSVTVNWVDIQLTSGGALVHPNRIDTAISGLRALNLAHPGLSAGLKIRVMGGIYAPNWAKQIGGTPFTVRSVRDASVSGTIGRFWLPAYGQAYRDLQSKLAADYDNVAEVRENQITRCTLVWDEPFNRWMKDPVDGPNLLAAGYTTGADQQCQRDEVDAHNAWQRTNSTLAFNPYTDADGTTDETFTEQMMGYCRFSLALRCVLSNESFDTARLNTDPANFMYNQMYHAAATLGAPISFQTENPSVLSSLPGTLAAAVPLGVDSIEMPPTYGMLISPTVLAGYRDQLMANSLAVQGPRLVTSSPKADAKVQGAFTVAGAASSDAPLQSVSVSVDGQNPVAASGTWGWSATLPALAAGPHSVVGKLTDGLGRVASASITVNVPDVTAPTVAITSPVTGAKLTSSTVTIGGVAADDLSLQSVSVVLKNSDGKWLQPNGTWTTTQAMLTATVSGSPSSATWTISRSLPAMTRYSVMAIATDGAKRQKWSTSVSFTVA